MSNDEIIQLLKQQQNHYIIRADRYSENEKYYLGKSDMCYDLINIIEFNNKSTEVKT